MQIDPALFEENERTAAKRVPEILTTGPLACECGAVLPSVDIAYMTFGELNDRGDNAVLVCHALSGNADCMQWWDRLIGPGKALDPSEHFIIGVNALGGCDGSTGPASKAPDGRAYGSRFPLVTVGDMVEVQVRLLDHLGIDRLKMACGGSMGGMQALEWTVRHPDRIRSAWLTASAASHSALQIAFNEAARQAVIRDPKWRGGDYPQDDPPSGGLAVARMIGHISFLSEAAFAVKFGRKLQGKEAFEYTLSPEFQVESYLNYQGEKFTKRFDANSLIVLTRAIDYYERSSLEGSRSKYLITSFTTDWLYPTSQSIFLEEMAKRAGCEVERFEIDLPFGHDAFLLDGEQQAYRLSRFLAGL